MYVIATFEHSLYVELALSAIEMEHVPKENILAVPLANRQTERQWFDTIHHSDGFSLLDLAAALATAFSVIGASIGFQLTWGPIIWGLIGAVFGAAAGLAIKLLLTKRRHKQRKKTSRKVSELILIIDCDNEQTQTIEEILWDHFALGVAKLDHTSDAP